MSCRVALVVRTDASLSLYPSRHVTFTVRYVLNTWRVVQGWPEALGLILTARRSESNITKPIRLGKQTYVMKWKDSQLTPNPAIRSQTEPTRTKPNRALHMYCVYLFRCPDSLIHFNCSASFLTRHVTSLLSCGLTLCFLRIPLVASRSLGNHNSACAVNNHKNNILSKWNM